MTESQYTRKLSDKLRYKNVFVIPVVGGTMQTVGLPDRLLIGHEFKMWVECKKEGNKLSSRQAYIMKRLRHYKENAFVLRYYESEDKLVLEREGWHKIAPLSILNDANAVYNFFKEGLKEWTDQNI